MELSQTRAALLAYYRSHRRDLPWRRTRDPYEIWVSEIMLQQTQVDTVVPRYRQFLERFGSVEELASATVEEVCEAWAGLGYYRRARNLHAAACQVMEELGGVMPRSASELQRLKGVGRYTAGAIASIAHGEEAPVVDGNVIRVLTRFRAIEGPPDKSEVLNQVWALAELLVMGKDPGDFNQALMEHGATVCTPAHPRCDACPIEKGCAARALGTVERFPFPKRKTAKKKLAIAFAWVEGAEGVRLQQRPVDGLWAGLWELPSEHGRGAKARLAKRLGVRLSGPVVKVSHQLSHRDVTATVYRTLSAPSPDAPGQRTYADPLGAPLSALARKAIEAFKAAK